MARWAMLAVSTALVLVALGAWSAQWQPSSARLLVTAVVGWLAPLFWPGRSSTPARTLAHIAGWSAAAAVLAAVVLRVLGGPAQPFPRIAMACAVLMLILLLTHLLVATLETWWRDRSVSAGDARERSGRTVAIALVLLGSLPLWLGPLAELLSRHHAWVIDTVVGMSPLTHLAVASGNDLLRNDWLYRHSNLAALQFSYPGLAELTGSYAIVCGLLTFATLASRRQRQPIAKPVSTHPRQENST